MKKILLLACLFSLFTCEKDDICEEGAAITPRLILTFYDETDPTEKKNVNDLFVFGFDDDNQIVLFQSSTITTTDSIAFPLRTDVNITRIGFFIDAEEDDNNNIISNNQDIIDFNYTRNDVYVSRACGFKATYLDLAPTLEGDSDNWILNIETVNQNVENELEAHVKIYH